VPIAKRLKTLVAVTIAVTVSSIVVPNTFAYQSGGTVSMGTQTGFSGLITTLTSTSAQIEPASTMNSGRDWSVDYLTYTPDIRTQRGLQWATYGTGCNMPSAGGNVSGCNKGQLTFTFSRPVLNPVFHIHDFGGRMEANCKLAIQGTLALAGSTPGSVTFSKLSGGIIVSGTSITGRSTSTAPFTESNHSSGSVRVTGLVKSLTFNFTVLLSRQGTTCSYDNATMLMSATERLNATFSYGEDMGDGPATYDVSSPASHIIGDLRMGSTALSAEAGTTINSTASPITASPLASANATGDNDDAISGTPIAANIGQGYSLAVPITGASQSGQVCGFIDMDNSGTYTASSPDERACTSFVSGATSAVLNWTAAQWPAGASPTTATGLRLRAAYGTNLLNANGPVDSGEVEDYRIALVAPDPPLATPLQSTGTQGANQTVSPATSQGQFVAGLTCIVDGTSCVSSLQVPGEGTYTVNANGTITFVPVPGFTGTATPITYRIEDSQGRQSTSTASLTVVPAPNASNDSTSTAYNTAKTVAVLGNDTVSTGATLLPSSVRLCDTGQTSPNCTATSVIVSGEGTYAVNSTTGEITFTPLSTFAGTSSINYQVSDTAGGKDSAQLSVSVAAPSGTDALPTTSTGGLDANQTITLSASAASATTLDPLKTCIVSETTCVRSLVVPNEGTYTVNANGTVTFDPLPTFTGSATPQTYQVEDRFGTTAQSTLTATVVPAPTVSPDTSAGSYNTVLSANLLGNDAPGTGATLLPTSLRLCNPTTTPAQTPNNCTVTAGTTISVPNVGTYVFNSSGVLTFTPAANFTGTAPALAYQVQDSLGQYGNSTFTPTVAAPPPPTAVADSSIGAQGTTQSVNLLANDLTSASGQTLSAGSLRLCSSGQTPPNCNATSVSIPGEGTFSLNTTTGVVTFTPCSAVDTPAGASCTEPFQGTATPLTYQVTSNTEQTSASTYTASVVGAPTAVDDTGTSGWNVNQTFSPTSNDSAASGASLNPIPLGICVTGTAAGSCTGTSLNVTGQGTYTLNTTTGVVTFDPAPNFTGSATPIQYAIADSIGQKSLATITPSVVPPPAPVATSGQTLVAPGASATFTTLTGVGGLALTGGPAFTTSATCLIDTSATPNTCGATLSIAGEGTYSLNPSTGVVTFTADPNATTGTKTPVTYRVTDETGQTATSTLTPIIPTPPIASNDTSYGEQNKEQSINLLGNDSSSQYTQLDSTSVKLCPTNATQPYTITNCNVTSVSITNEGTYNLNSNGTLTFTPCTLAGTTVCPSSTVFSGPVTSIRYVVADSIGQLTNASVSPIVLPPPATGATSDTGTAAFGQSIVFNPLTNDTPGTLTGLLDAGYTSVGSASLVPSSVKLCAGGETPPSCTATTLVTPSGTYVVNTTTGNVTFTPAINFAGTPPTSPTYVVCNQMSGSWSPLTPTASCASASLTATIALPDTPVASNDSSTGEYNTTQNINVLVNDTKDGSLSLVASSVKLCGTGQVSPNCTLTTLTVAGEGTYTVNPSTGIVSFTPLPTFAGSVSTPVPYQVKDSFGATSSALITPSVSYPAEPRALPETKPVLPGSTATFTNIIGTNALASGTELQSGAQYGPCLVDPSDSICKTSFSIAGEGTWSINQLTGIAQFAASSLVQSGELTPVMYQVTDAVGQTTMAELAVVVPQAATVLTDASINAVDIDQIISPLTNDTPGTATVFNTATVKLCGAGQVVPFCTATTIQIPNEGSYSVLPDGKVLFDPLPDFVGYATPTNYQVTDSLGRSYSAAITPRVTTTPPTYLSDAVTLQAGSTAAFRSIFGNDALVTPATSGPNLRTDTACLADPASNTCGVSVIIDGEGTYSLDPITGVVTFTAESGAQVGPRTPVIYRIIDADGFIADGTLTPTILAPPENQSPPSNSESPAGSSSTPSSSEDVTSSSSKKKASAINRKNWVRPSTPAYFNPTAFATPSKGERFDTSLTRLWDEKNARWSIEVETEDGRWTVIRNSVRFIPRDGFLGQSSIQFKIEDSAGKTAQATLTAVVNENAPMLPETGADISPIVLFAFFLLINGGVFVLFRKKYVHTSVNTFE
jgi:CshA-type fibril repeat protein